MNRPELVPAIDLRQIAEVQLAIGAKKVGRLLGLACAELASRPRAMRELADANHLALMRREAHGFKGAVASVGLVGAARAAKAVELALPGPDLHHSLDRLESEAGRALVAVRSLLARCGQEAASRP
jgi:HPt (histidine-containing phosphotransfer) domain-containing protein